METGKCKASSVCLEDHTLLPRNKNMKQRDSSSWARKVVMQRDEISFKQVLKTKSLNEVRSSALSSWISVFLYNLHRCQHIEGLWSINEKSLQRKVILSNVCDV